MTPDQEQADAGGALPPRPSDLRDFSPTVTFRDLQAQNRRRSAALIASMIALTAVLGGAIGALISVSSGAANIQPSQTIDLLTLAPGAALGAFAGIGLATLGALWSYYAGASAVLSISGAREIARADDPALFDLIDGLRLAGGIPMPSVYLINSPALNAFATGRDPEHAAVAITAGLRQRLAPDELAGVMAHELSHVRHLDIRIMTLTATMVGLIVLVCDLMRNWIRWGPTLRGRGGRDPDNKGAGVIMLVLFVIVLVLSIVAPILSTIIHLAVSRQREFLADAGAVELTRDPEGLIKALRKLGSSREPLATATRATEHMFIVRPLGADAEDDEHEADSVFSTHPPIAERIRRLQALLR